MQPIILVFNNIINQNQQFEEKLNVQSHFKNQEMIEVFFDLPQYE